MGSKVRRLKSFLNSKEHLKGGVSLANMFYRCITLVEDAFGKTDVRTMHSDKIKRDNKGTKEFHKFKLGFDIVDSLPSEFDKLTEDLLISITNYVYEPTKSFSEWTKEACTNACAKGHTVLFKEKIYHNSRKQELIETILLS